MPEQGYLLEWAVQHAEGRIGRRLFPAWANVRRDLAGACTKLGIPRCSPNDLRRTYASWLRAEGIEPQLIAAAMGHGDSRLALTLEALPFLPLDARAAYLLSLGDGHRTVEMIPDICVTELAPDEALAIVAHLLHHLGAIDVREP